MHGRPALLLLAVTLPLLAVKVLVSALLELTSVESYLWVCAQHPALAYTDYPGMSPWLIQLSTAMFGHGEAGLRALSMLCGPVSAWLLSRTALRLYGPREATWALALGMLLPLFLVYGTIATPDAPLLLFWSATLWAFTRALQGAPAWWFLSGLFLGLAMDSKYQAVFLGLGLLGFLAASPEHRGKFRTAGPWLALAAALLAFAPTLVWNARNDWASFRYQGVERFREAGFRPRDLVDFPVSQMLWLTPTIAGIAWAAGAKTLLRWRAASSGDRLCAATGLPLLLFLAAVLFLRPVRGHWGVPAYASLLPLVAAVLVRGSERLRRFHAGLAAVLAVAVLAGPMILALAPPRERHGWHRLAAATAARDPDFVLGREYHLASQLAYRLRPLPVGDFSALGRGSKMYPRWWDPAPHRGKSAVIVYDGRPREGEEALVRAAFDKTGPLEDVEIPRLGGRTERFTLQKAWGYTGPGGR